MSGALMKVKAFAADLPDLSPEQLAQVYGWCKKKFDKFDVQERGGQGYLLVAVCKDQEAKSIRQWQTLIRTNLQHWRVDLPTTAQRGWLRAVSADEYEEAILSTPGEYMASGVSGATEGDDGCVTIADEGPEQTTASEEPNGSDEDSTTVPESREEEPTLATDSKIPKVTQMAPGLLSCGLALPKNLLLGQGRHFALLHQEVATR